MQQQSAAMKAATEARREVDEIIAKLMRRSELRALRLIVRQAAQKGRQTPG